MNGNHHNSRWQPVVQTIAVIGDSDDADHLKRSGHISFRLRRQVRNSWAVPSLT